MSNSRSLDNLIKVVLFYPKSKTRNYSIETLFDEVRKSLPEAFAPAVHVPKYTSNGVWKRVVNIINAAFHQGDINHVIGDVHFLTLLLRRQKTILTIHDCVFMYHPSKSLRLLYKLFWLHLPIRCSKYITVVSEATKAEVIKYSNCSPQKISVIPNFISEDYTYCRKHFNSVKPVILHIGVAGNKNLDRLIHALKDVSCTLHIIGRLEANHITLLHDCKIDYKSFFSLSAGQMRQRYMACDLVAFASIYEGFGLPILEAQTVGRPVVTSQLSSMPEVAGDGACLVDPYDVQDIRRGVIRVIEDEEFRNQLIENGLRNVGRFNRKKIIGQYAHLYKRVCEQAN